MTPQEMFDTAVRGVLQQGGSSNEHGLCMYRSRTGRKCAAGWLLPDDLYDENMERTTVSGLRQFDKIAGEHINFVISLQRVHDLSTYSSFNDEEFLNFFRERAFKFANQYSLSTAVLEEETKK